MLFFIFLIYWQFNLDWTPHPVYLHQNLPQTNSESRGNALAHNKNKLLQLQVKVRLSKAWFIFLMPRPKAIYQIILIKSYELIHLMSYCRLKHLKICVGLRGGGGCYAQLLKQETANIYIWLGTNFVAQTWLPKYVALIYNSFSSFICSFASTF